MSRYRDKDGLELCGGCPPFSRCCGFGVAFLVIIPYVVYEAVVGRLAGCINSCLGCNADNANCHGMKLHATPSPQPFIKD